MIGALLLLAVTLAGLVFALRYMDESLEPYRKKPRVGACIGVGLVALTPPATAFAGLPTGAAMLVFASVLLATLAALIARGTRVRRRIRGPS